MAAQYGLIGYPLEHSFSPAWFAEKFAREGVAATYKAYPLEHIEVIEDLLDNYPLKGINVTIPYKNSVIEHLHELDLVAAEIGAVNCIDIRNRRRKGYNTDVIGFEKSLVPLLSSQHTKALVLGTGGSARAVNYVLGRLGIEHTSVSRHLTEGVLAYAELTPDIIAGHTVTLILLHWACLQKRMTLLPYFMMQLAATICYMILFTILKRLSFCNWAKRKALQ